MQNYLNRTLGVILFFLFILLMFVVGYWFVDTGEPGSTGLPAHIRWLVIVGLMLVFMGLLGWQIRGRTVGVLVDNRNKISLSRFQLTAWTILIMSAFLTIGLGRSRIGYVDVLTAEMVAQCEEDIRETIVQTDEGEAETQGLARQACVTQPLQISFPSEVVAALGISTVSLVGSSLIKRNKGETDQSRSTIITLQEKERSFADEAAAEQDRLSAIEIEIAELSESAIELDIRRAEAAEYLALALTDEEKQEAQAVLDAVEAEQRNLKGRLALLEAERRTQEKLAKAADSKWNAFLEGQHSGMGLQHRNSSVHQANWADMFRGEEITNFETIEIAKVQMFFFTIAVVFTYAAMLFTMLQDSAALRNPLGVELPAFTASLNYLLLVSHAGYLTQKYSTSS